MAIAPFGTNGLWARPHNEESIRILLDQQRADPDERAGEYEHSLLLRRELRAKVCALFHRHEHP